VESVKFWAFGNIEITGNAFRAMAAEFEPAPFPGFRTNDEKRSES
jgi:hypothetical protein